jgi:hypothetical protein
MNENKLDPHPWQEFLNARARCILWLSKELKESDAEIMFHLSMDETQVRLIRQYVENENG